MALHTILLKPVSGLCNMSCDYCFYCDETKKRDIPSYGMMSEETLGKLIRRAMRQAGGEICFAFQGGEPTLRGIEFYQKAVELEQRFGRGRLRVLNTIQTNGLELDERWCRLFRDHNFLVGISLDGIREVHDRYRRDSAGKPTYERVRESIRMLDEFGVEYNILTVVTAQTAEHIQEIYRKYVAQRLEVSAVYSLPGSFGRETGKQGVFSDPGTLRRVSGKAVPYVG